MTHLKSIGLQQEWFENNKIAILTLHNTNMETLELWSKTTQQIISNWPANTPYRILHDYSRVDIILSPYMRRKSEEIMQARPDLSGKAGLVLKRSVVAHLAQTIFNTIWKKGYQSRQRKIFFSREDGLKWLQEPL